MSFVSFSSSQNNKMRLREFVLKTERSILRFVANVVSDNDKFLADIDT